MTVKRMKRRPVFPILLTLLILAGTCLAAFLETGIAENKEAVDDLYQNTEVVYRILPGPYGTSELKVPPALANTVESASECTSISRSMECPVALSGDGLFTFSWVNAVGGVEEFVTRHDMEVEWGTGYSSADFEEEGRYVCLMEKNLAEQFELIPGDLLSIAGCLGEYQLDEESTQYVPFELAGTYSCAEATAPTGKVLIPEQCFYEYNGILYNSAMRKQWQVYTYYSFALKKEYNREYVDFQTKLQEVMDALGSFTLYGTTRELENSVVMLERRVQTMETLQPPILLSILLGTAVVTAFNGMGKKTDLLIRLLFGESKMKVLLSEWFNMACELLLTAIPGGIAMGILYLTRGEILLSLKLLLAELCTCGITSLIVLAISLKESLVQLYQKTKGD